jgi:NAD(P)-dependent dehydrogenase (short-subunit alcohol dehydrogenase family)
VVLIYVNAVNPGLIDTQIARDVVSGDEDAYTDIAKSVPIGRAGKPEEIAAAVLWLCSPVAFNFKWRWISELIGVMFQDYLA